MILCIRLKRAIFCTCSANQSPRNKTNTFDFKLPTSSFGHTDIRTVRSFVMQIQSTPAATRQWRKPSAQNDPLIVTQLTVVYRRTIIHPQDLGTGCERTPESCSKQNAQQLFDRFSVPIRVVWCQSLVFGYVQSWHWLEVHTDHGRRRRRTLFIRM